MKEGKEKREVKCLELGVYLVKPSCGAVRSQGISFSPLLPSCPCLSFRGHNSCFGPAPTVSPWLPAPAIPLKEGRIMAHQRCSCPTSQSYYLRRNVTILGKGELRSQVGVRLLIADLKIGRSSWIIMD